MVRVKTPDVEQAKKKKRPCPPVYGYEKKTKIVEKEKNKMRQAGKRVRGPRIDDTVREDWLNVCTKETKAQERDSTQPRGGAHTNVHVNSIPLRGKQGKGN